MNHSLKNPDAHRRLARGANAGVKVRGFSRLYQAGAEFKARQMWLDFKDAVGTALEAIAASVEASRKAFKAWQKAFVRNADVVKPSMDQLLLSLVEGEAGHDGAAFESGDADCFPSAPREIRGWR